MSKAATITHREMLNRIRDLTGVSTREADRVLAALAVQLRINSKALEPTHIYGFGVFYAVWRPNLKVRNIRTGVWYPKPPHTSPRFRMSRVWLRAMNPHLT